MDAYLGGNASGIASAAGRTLESFGATGGTDDTAAVQDAITWALANNSRVIGRTDRTYKVRTPFTVNVAADQKAILDFGGATLQFEAGGGLLIGNQAPTPFLTTTSSAGVTRRGTKIVVTSAAGVAIGDLMVVSSPVEWVAGINLRQTYVVSDVDSGTGEVWVEGRIVGDITPAQITTAGLTGNVTVSFYKLAERIELRNVTLVSPLKDSKDLFVGICGARRVLLDNVHVKRPNRIGVNTNLCGTVEVVGCSTSEHGYTNKDRGYANSGSDPSGQSFGYGFLASDCYSFQARGCNSYSGWHGFDASRGVSYALWDGCVAHKDAYGFSTHEGAWVMEVRNCEVIGGLGITCRGAELLVIGGRFATSLGAAITAHPSLQELLIKGVTIDCAAVSSLAQATPLYLTGAAYPAATCSAEPPTSTIDGLTILNAVGMSTVTVRGDLTLANVVTKGRPDVATSTSQMKVVGPGSGKLVMHNLITDGIGAQFAYGAEAWTSVEVSNVRQAGVVGLPAGSAFLVLTGTTAATVRLENCAAPGMDYLVRSSGPALTVSVLACSGKRMLLADATSTFKALVHSRTNTSTLMAGGVAAPTTALNNAVVPD